MNFDELRFSALPTTADTAIGLIATSRQQGKSCTICYLRHAHSLYEASSKAYFIKTITFSNENNNFSLKQYISGISLINTTCVASRLHTAMPAYLSLRPH